METKAGNQAIRKTVRLKYDYGETDLNIIGDPNRVFDIPIAYYSSPVFCVTLLGEQRDNKLLEILSSY